MEGGHFLLRGFEEGGCLLLKVLSRTHCICLEKVAWRVMRRFRILLQGAAPASAWRRADVVLGGAFRIPLQFHLLEV